MGNRSSAPSVVELAQAQKLQAEAEAARKMATATADATRATSDATSDATRATADATRATADATRAMSDATSDATRAKAAATVALTIAPLVVISAVGFVLAADFLVHDVRAINRWQMLRRLRRCRVPLTALSQPSACLPRRFVRLQLGALPTMLLGETGSGKTMEMAQTAREAASPPPNCGLKPRPVVYIRMRQPKTHMGDVASGDMESANSRLEATAQQVFQQINYPSRASLVGTMWARLTHFKVGDMEGKLQSNLVPRDRLVSALRLLFEVAEQLYVERTTAGFSVEQAPVMLLFDEVQDLIKDSRLANAGGRFVFEELAVLLVAYGVDRRVVHSAVAGSSALLSVEFDKTVASGMRWNYQEMEDPDVPTIVSALVAKGYTADEAQRMVGLVGTRLRLLERPLERGPKGVSCDVFLSGARKSAVANFLEILSAEAEESVLIFLERLVAHEAGDAEAPLLRDMPDRLRALDFAKVLYVRRDRTVTFQSQLHRSVWRELRSKYICQLR